MKRITGIGAALCLAIGALLAAPAGAVDSSPNETARELAAAAEKPGDHPWNATIDQSWLPASGFREAGRATGGSLTLHETGVKVGRFHSVSPDLTLSTYLTYSLRSIDAPGTAALPDHLHTLSVGLAGDYRLTDTLALDFLVAPGLSGDFRQIGADDVRTQVGLLGRYDPTKKWSLMAGVIYLQGYRSVPVLPIAGAVYRPTEQWTIRLAAPRPGVIYTPDKVSSYFAVAEFTGSEYQVHDTALGAKIVNYRDFRVMAGLERLLFSAVRVALSAGYVFDRRFVFYDSARNDLTIDNGAVVRLGVSTAW